MQSSMQIVKPYAKMMHPAAYGTDCGAELPFTTEDGLALIRRIEWCARISHRSEESMTEDSWKRIIQSVVIDHGDWSVTEHAIVSVDMLVDRGITHEIVRHRICAFTQESTRFCNYGKSGEIKVIAPEFSSETAKACWLDSIRKSEEEYLRLLNTKTSPQVARSVLPNSLASRIIVTANLRNWRHIFIMRTTREAHPQMREVMIPLLEEFQSKIPLLFDDIEPMAKQSEGMKRAR